MTPAKSKSAYATAVDDSLNNMNMTLCAPDVVASHMNEMENDEVGNSHV